MKLLKFWNRMGIFVLTIIVVLACWMILGNRFVSIFNINNVLVQVCPTIIAGIGMVYVITAGEIDMSIGSIYTITTIVIGIGLTRLNVGIAGSILLAVAVGIICGLVNGMLVTGLRLPSFIATLASMLAFKGVSYIISGGKDILYLSNEKFQKMSSMRFLNFSLPIWVMLLLTLSGIFIYKRTSFGIYVRSVGSNKEVTAITGINVNLITIMGFVMTGIFAVFGGVITASQTLIGTSTAGATYSLDCVCATVLGGTSMTGRKGNIPGMICAAVLLGFLKNALNMLNLPFYYQYIVTGVILVFALVMNNLQLLLSQKYMGNSLN